jgi:NitT/TauT family transport system substrate-binding protein
MRPDQAGATAPVRRRRAGALVSPRLRHAAVALAGLSLAAAAAGCDLPGSSASGAVPAGVTVSVGVVPGIENATMALAQHNGLFSAAGIKVKIVRFGTVRQAMAALNSGAVDIADGDYANLFSAQAASPASPVYRIVADGYDAAPGVLELMTLPTSRLKSPEQVAGLIGAPNTERVSVPRGAPDSLAIATADSVLQSFGVNLSGVTWDSMAPLDEIRALQEGRVQAVLLAEPYIYLAQRQLGAVELIDACSGATAGLPLAGYFSTVPWASRNAATISAFRSGLKEAAAQAAMPGPVQAVLPGYTGLSKQEAALLTLGVYPASTIAASLQRTADLMFGEGVIRFRLNVAAMISR